MNLSDEIEKVITFYPVIGSLPARLQHAFLQSSYPVHAEKEHVLIDEDHPIDAFLLLTSGSIRVISPGKERELLLYRVQPGGCCILTICHLLGDMHYPVRAQVEEDITGVALPPALFKEMVDSSPLFCAFLFASFGARLAELLALLEDISCKDLHQRLGELLITRGPCIPLTHAQLADELGSVREVVSRVLKDFEAKGLVELKRGQIRVLNEKSLRETIHLSDSGH